MACQSKGGGGEEIRTTKRMSEIPELSIWLVNPRGEGAKKSVRLSKRPRYPKSLYGLSIQGGRGRRNPYD